MGLQVLVVGRLRPELGVSGAHEGVAVADIRHPDAVQDAVTRLTGGNGSLLVLCAREDTLEIRRQLVLVGVALPRVTPLLEPVDGSPLAVAAVAALVDDAEGTRDPAHQLAVLDFVREHLWSAVWLPSVTKVTHPQPSLGQHVRSWLGGPGFLAVHGRSARVLPCRDTAIPAVDGAPAAGVLMTADTGAPEWVVPSAARALQVSRQMHYPSWRDPRDAFGVASCAELLVVPADLDDPGTVPTEAAECLGCGNRHARPVCPYCRMLTPSAEDLQGAAT